MKTTASAEAAAGISAGAAFPAEFSPAYKRDAFYLAAISACISLGALVFYFRHNQILLSGDAIAHINIARRVFDSRTPGLVQLGTVWLPLPHIMMMPFVVSDWAWRTGIGGAVPSMVAYIAGVLGIFRLLRGGLRNFCPENHARMIAWAAALIYAANPNLTYVQATALTEPLYLALFTWAVVFFSEFAVALRENKNHAGRSLRWCGACLFAAMLTRYDGWVASAFMAAVTLVLVIASGGRRLGKAFLQFALVLAAVPVLWLGYNAAAFDNPLEFATGEYSARAIAERSVRSGQPEHPGFHDPKTAAAYFLKAARLNAGEGGWQTIWLSLALAGTAGLLIYAPQLSALLLLWLPLPFYALSIAYGGVPIFVPAWWPFSYYNVRYGVELLPALAVFPPLAAYFLGVAVKRPRWNPLALLALLTFVVGNYISVCRAIPVSLREAQVNGGARMALQTRLAAELQRLPASATLIMYSADQVGVLERAGIPLRRVIHEGNAFEWHASLRAPLPWMEYALAFAGDPVDKFAREHPRELSPVFYMKVAGQPAATLYAYQAIQFTPAR